MVCRILIFTVNLYQQKGVCRILMFMSSSGALTSEAKPSYHISGPLNLKQICFPGLASVDRDLLFQNYQGQYHNCLYTIKQYQH